jgi:hypothetical protein
VASLVLERRARVAAPSTDPGRAPGSLRAHPPAEATSHDPSGARGHPVSGRARRESAPGPMPPTGGASAYRARARSPVPRPSRPPAPQASARWSRRHSASTKKGR